MPNSHPSDLEWLTHPAEWPNWPVQTVKKRRSNGQMPDVGLVVERENVVEPIVYDVNLWALPVPTPWPIAARYDSIEAMIADGWEVD